MDKKLGDAVTHNHELVDAITNIAALTLSLPKAGAETMYYFANSKLSDNNINEMKEVLSNSFNDKNKVESYIKSLEIV